MIALKVVLGAFLIVTIPPVFSAIILESLAVLKRLLRPSLEKS